MDTNNQQARIATADIRSRMKIAELNSSFGAGVIGLSLGLLLGTSARFWWPWILVAGIVLHAWGMREKNRLETGHAVNPIWSKIVYWACWVFLALAGMYAAVRIGSS